MFKSKKFWMTLMGIIGALVADNADQPWYVVVSIVVGAAAYTIGQGVSDNGKERARLVIEAVGEGFQLGADGGDDGHPHVN